MDYTVWLKKSGISRLTGIPSNHLAGYVTFGSSTESLKPNDKRESLNRTVELKREGETQCVNSKLTGFYECLNIKGN